MTTFPIKQGGLAAQQADAAAEAVAAAFGVAADPAAFRPVLRALLLTGGRPLFLEAGLAGGGGETSKASDEALWWPAGKIVGRHLAPFLAGLGVVDARWTMREEELLRVEIAAAAAHQLSWRQ
jgi:sulfide:quinone oxidoreductase